MVEKLSNPNNSIKFIILLNMSCSTQELNLVYASTNIYVLLYLASSISIQKMLAISMI